jgi:uncharacterized protein (TIGR02246 family)
MRSGLSCVSQKRFKTLIHILMASAWAYCLPLMAQELKGWHSESLQKNSDRPKPDVQQIDAVLLKMLDRWNAHDIAGYLDVYRKSPDLLVIVDSEQFNGWQQLHDSYVSAYRNPRAMGFIQPQRIQIKMLKPDFALALTWWSISFPDSKQKVVGNTTMDFQKFDDGWKILISHTSTNAA